MTVATHYLIDKFINGGTRGKGNHIEITGDEMWCDDKLICLRDHGTFICSDTAAGLGGICYRQSTSYVIYRLDTEMITRKNKDPNFKYYFVRGWAEKGKKPLLINYRPRFKTEWGLARAFYYNSLWHRNWSGIYTDNNGDQVIYMSVKDIIVNGSWWNHDSITIHDDKDNLLALKVQVKTCILEGKQDCESCPHKFICYTDLNFGKRSGLFFIENTKYTKLFRRYAVRRTGGVNKFEFISNGDYVSPTSISLERAYKLIEECRRAGGED
jgi:hypothetical protein